MKGSVFSCHITVPTPSAFACRFTVPTLSAFTCHITVATPAFSCYITVPTPSAFSCRITVPTPSAFSCRITVPTPSAFSCRNTVPTPSAFACHITVPTPSFQETSNRKLLFIRASCVGTFNGLLQAFWKLSMTFVLQTMKHHGLVATTMCTVILDMTFYVCLFWSARIQVNGLSVFVLDCRNQLCLYFQYEVIHYSTHCSF
jgi:hypothetical protein